MKYHREKQLPGQSRHFKSAKCSLFKIPLPRTTTGPIGVLKVPAESEETAGKGKLFLELRIQFSSEGTNTIIALEDARKAEVGKQILYIFREQQHSLKFSSIYCVMSANGLLLIC